MYVLNNFVTFKLSFLTQRLSITDRSNLLDDAFNLARAGHLGYDVALDMTSYLEKETEYLPWKSSARALSYISNMLEFTGDYSLLQVMLNNFLVQKIWKMSIPREQPKQRNENCRLGFIESVHEREWKVLHLSRPLEPVKAVFDSQY